MEHPEMRQMRRTWRLTFAALIAIATGSATLLPPVASAAFREKVLYSFCSQRNCLDGAYPSNLIGVNGELYGTASAVFFPPPIENRGCCGNVFSLDPSTGAEKTVYAFCSKPGCADGSHPSSLIDVEGTLYGTTFDGGTGFARSQYGTAFALDPNTGAENVVYSFCSQPNCPDGSHPTSLIAVNGTLYGTTETGGTGDYSPCPGCGAAFALDPGTGNETVLYSFCSQKNCTDGSNPNPGLLAVNGILYGVTVTGGTYGCGNGQACGTVFSLDPDTGAHTVLHSFGNGADGKYPEAALIALHGVLYGTTYAGGVPGCGPFGCGTVYALNPSAGAEEVVYSFCSQPNCADGANPFASLADVNGMLYSTALSGGAYGYGAVFALDPGTGAETVLYSFCSQQNCTDGADPYSLIAMNGKLYGTTSAGGAYGYGTVFVLEQRH